MESMIQYLKRDTAETSQVLASQSRIFKKMDSALKISVECLKDINTRRTFYHYFVYFYSWVDGFTPYDNTITQLKNGAGFICSKEKCCLFYQRALYILGIILQGQQGCVCNFAVHFCHAKYHFA